MSDIATELANYSQLSPGEYSEELVGNGGCICKKDKTPQWLNGLMASLHTEARAQIYL